MMRKKDILQLVKLNMQTDEEKAQMRQLTQKSSRLKKVDYKLSSTPGKTTIKYISQEKTAEEIRADDQARKATEEAKTATRVRNSSGDARAANRARMATEEPKAATRARMATKENKVAGRARHTTEEAKTAT